MRKPTLLFVDDEPTIRITMGIILQQEGFEVETAASVAEALELIGKRSFDVLLSDLNIGTPGDGFIVVTAMRRMQPQAAAFILTGYPDFESALTAIRNQVDDYFTKPADVPMLVNSIRARLEGEKRSTPPVRTRPISDLVRTHAQRIHTEWLASVIKDKSCHGPGLQSSDVEAYVPALLRELITRLESSAEEISPTGISDAQKYGRLRRDQGCSVSQLVQETRILQKIISSAIQNNLLGVDLSRLVPDLIQVGETLASFLEIAVSAYQHPSEQLVGASES
ncbi:MAG: response regulator [Acidobacteriaceae bacterium]|nr:response regulator [Acidobacteriaceae bacterium]